MRAQLSFAGLGDEPKMERHIDVPVGRIIAVRDRGRDLAVARLASGRVVVVDDVCPHDGGPISDGYVDGEVLVCARHGWSLRACRGRCVRATSSPEA
jgi:phenylpropionate dioxygenase-like ring-hydroxylating dioxygenase large terminal subunit